MPQSYLRIKRQKQTYFVMCTPQDTVGFIKQQISLANKELKADQIRLILPKSNTILTNDDEKIQTHEDEIKNEAELHCVFKISEDGEWESVHIAAADIGADAP